MMPIKNIEPSKFHPEKKWMATHFKVEKPDGTTEEVESQRVALKITGKDGTVVEVPAFAAHHIMSLHLKGEEAGSTMETGSLESSFKLIAQRMPDRLPFKKDSAAFEMEVGQPTGTEGVTSQKEMVEKGIVTQEDIDLLNTAKEEVFRLNIEGTEDEKKKYIEEFNAKMAGRNVKLGLRAGAVAPFFSADRQPTTRMFMVVGNEKDEDGSEHKRVWTMTPGRFMDRLPSDNRFIGRTASEGVPEGTTVSSIWKKLHNGEKLSDGESTLLEEQRKAQECWWDGGFIVPPEKKMQQAA